MITRTYARDLHTSATAIYSPCEAYRYRLEIKWDGFLRDDPVHFLMLNPSTATEQRNDPTVARCTAYARGWGYRGLIVSNLFAYRATDPADMKRHPSPIGPENDHYILDAYRLCGLTICAWGRNGGHIGRDREVLSALNGAPLFCLRQTNGVPHHPLYLPKTLTPIPLEAQVKETRP